MNHHLESRLSKNRFLYFCTTHNFSIPYVYSRELFPFSIFGWLYNRECLYLEIQFKENVKGYFFTKITIPINYKGYKESLGVALRVSQGIFLKLAL